MENCDMKPNQTPKVVYAIAMAAGATYLYCPLAEHAYFTLVCLSIGFAMVCTTYRLQTQNTLVDQICQGKVQQRIICVDHLFAKNHVFA